LIVDDEVPVLNLFERLLSKLDCKVVTTSSPHEALQKLKESEIAVVISDHEMPELTGVQLLEQAKLFTPDTIRIMVTAHDNAALEIDAKNLATVHRYLLKPVEPRILQDIIEDALWFYENQKRKKENKEYPGDRALKLDQLRSGMILSRPVVSKKDRVLLPQNAELTPSRLTYLKHLDKESEPIDEMVFVYQLRP